MTDTHVAPKPKVTRTVTVELSEDDIRRLIVSWAKCELGAPEDAGLKLECSSADTFFDLSATLTWKE
jgi:hypothetical protein